MDITIFPQKLAGAVSAIPSKSQAHRLFLCAALADKPTTIEIPTLCDDLVATIRCITGFGAEIEHQYGKAEIIIPATNKPQRTIIGCGESGSTLRFMLPLAGALGIDTIFLLEGRLPYRPLSPLWEEMNRMGCHLSWMDKTELQQACQEQGVRLSHSVTAGLHLTGQLRAGHFRLDGNVSSQFISGLLMALPILDGESRLELVGPLESKPYVDLTLQVLKTFGVHWNDFKITGPQVYRSPEKAVVEGDWSNAAFWLAAAALGSDVTVTGLNPASAQGDKEICNILARLEHHCTISAADIPDLIPILAVVAAAKEGAVFTDIRRLRMKESDRVSSVINMLAGLGVRAVADENTLTVYPATLIGGTVDSVKDHRIAMSAAIASTVCTQPVTILGADSVAKSYPSFWKEFTRLGGKI